MAPSPGGLVIDAGAAGEATVLTPRGVLDGATYRQLRDRIIKAALDGPHAVIVDVTGLLVPAESAWSVFTSARWHVARWPDVPVALVCEHSGGRAAIRRNGVARYLPVYATIGAALAAHCDSDARRVRRRARVDFDDDDATLVRARAAVEEWLTRWSHTAYIPAAKVVATALVENVLQHTASRPSLRLETDGTVVTVAVEDTSAAPAHVHEAVEWPDQPSGLRIVAALCRMWGNAPTSTGKTVWAVLGPEKCL
ncbi:STAS domain-containing protein [Mycobacterium sp. WMMD1722]|uniref:STAS domain-containing protein n=1 Tax=Mycobacterium sp. WMMD1722 TaxID=3404117 RepID=UPI003BF4C94B